MSKDVAMKLTHVESFPLALEIIQKLADNGHTAYFAGGCVRDALLGIKPKDIDIATTALPDEVERLFTHTVAVGKKFGIIVVVHGKHNIEVATFRKESDYRDGRRPENIEYSGPEEDSVRRDFTVNALFYDPIKKEVIDFQKGIEDIEQKRLRCVGNPDKRFSEDYLRILRCFRFALVLDFEIEPATLQSALKHKDGLKQISQERKRDELLKAALNLSHPWRLVCEFSTRKLWNVYGLPNEILDYKDYLFADAIHSEAEFLIKILWELEGRIDLKPWLKEFKCSTEVRQQVLRSLEFKKNLNSILDWSEEETHFFSYKTDLRLVLDVVKVEMSSPFYKSNIKSAELTKKIDYLYKLMTFYSANPVKPVVNGDDLKNRFQGAELGRVLDLLFRKQLVFKWTRTEEALRWLETNSDKKQGM
jgi:tRNA nucleotidyltransferase/poly(A) polymerase